MKNINECFSDIQSIQERVQGDSVNEGLKDILKVVKEKFKKAFQYLKGIVINVGSYFLPVDENGNVQPCITPLTAGKAYKDGMTGSNTFVHLDKEGAKIVGLNNKFEDAVNIYPKESSLKYWASCYESAFDENGNMINEVKMHTEDPQAKYNIICDDDELKQEVRVAIKNDVARLMIWGAPGIGKTAILMKVIDEMKKDFPDYKLICKTLSNETPDNFTLPKYIDVNGAEFATDVPKTWLPVYKPTGDKLEDSVLSEKCGHGLLFVDELSRATPQVLNVVLPLVNEGVFNGYKLGSGWTIICASNRDEDELAGQSSIGNALSNRFAQVYYEPTVKTWRTWADKQKFISPLLLQWLSMPESENMSGAKFFYMDPNEDIDSAASTKIMCTPRSWTNAMRELAVYANTGTLEGFTIFDIPRNTLLRVLNKYVPSTAVDSFIAFLDVIGKVGNFDHVVNDIWHNGGKSFKVDKKDLNKITLPLAQLIVSAHSDSLPTEEEWENLATWLVAQSSDQLASYVLDIFKTVFFNDVPEEMRNSIFVLRAKYDKATDAQKKMYGETLKVTLNKWKTDLNTFPNYMPGLQVISKKYGASFMSAIVDGKEALG